MQKPKVKSFLTILLITLATTVIPALGGYRALECGLAGCDLVTAVVGGAVLTVLTAGLALPAIIAAGAVFTL